MQLLLILNELVAEVKPTNVQQGHS